VIDAARFAARVAAMTCGRAGADPPRLGEIGSQAASRVGEASVEA
jgi:hypothetical protein